MRRRIRSAMSRPSALRWSLTSRIRSRAMPSARSSSSTAVSSATAYPSSCASASSSCDSARTSTSSGRARTSVPSASARSNDRCRSRPRAAPRRRRPSASASFTSGIRWPDLAARARGSWGRPSGRGGLRGRRPVSSCFTLSASAMSAAIASENVGAVGEQHQRPPQRLAHLELRLVARRRARATRPPAPRSISASRAASIARDVGDRASRRGAPTRLVVGRRGCGAARRRGTA